MKTTKCISLLQLGCADFNTCIQLDKKNTSNICKFQTSEILQLTYYCGSAPICKKGGNFDVLQRAKYNVEAYYSLVGMAQDLKRSFELLEVLLPAFFSGVKSIFKEDIKFNKNNYPPIKTVTLKALMNIPAIQGELEFYHFAQQRFEKQYRVF